MSSKLEEMVLWHKEAENNLYKKQRELYGKIKDLLTDWGNRTGVKDMYVRSFWGDEDRIDHWEFKKDSWTWEFSLRIVENGLTNTPYVQLSIGTVGGFSKENTEEIEKYTALGYLASHLGT